MKNLIKYFKKSYFIIIIVFLMLASQAYCDLSLPKYTANMVNIGIQENGITTSIPKVISENKLNNLLIFADDIEKKEIKKEYKKLKKNQKNQKKYPLLKKESIYYLKNKENKQILTDFFERTLMIDQFLTDDQLNKQIKEKMHIKNNDNIYNTIKLMPENNLNLFRKEINKKMNNIEPSIISQATKTNIKKEYKKIGINTNDIQTSYIVKTGIIMLAIALISMILTIFVSYFSAKISANIGKNIRKDIFNKVLSFSSSEFKKFEVPSLITRSTNDITQIQMLIVTMLRIVFYAPIMAIGGIIMVLNTNTKMTWIIAVGVFIILLIVLILFIIAMPKFKLLQKLIDKINLVSREILSGLSVIRAFSTEKHEEKRFKKSNTDLMKTNLFISRTMSIMMPLMMLTMNLITVTIVWIGAKHINLGNMQVGDMMAFMQYTIEIIMSFLMISMVSIILPRSLVSINRINEVLNTKNSIIDPKNPKQLNKEKNGLIEFKNVSFRYEDANYDVITDITFTANKGETTALIGSTGSGKSTIVNLIPRFFDVTGGNIYIDGTNIKDIKIHDLREKIGFVPQKGVLFTGTIKSNITYGSKVISKERLEKAIEISQSKEFIDKLKKGVNSEIAQSGKNVSGGQRQRLSIARAIYKDPEILIFDDSFSALDFKTDAKLRHKLKEITKDKTIIIVAQRISTIMNAEKIIVLDEGKIVGMGSHSELLKTCDIYKQIALSQLSKEEVE
ncbi:MAG: ABC transporter ATP-binding protein [Bacilli bacterium]|nr:ABC transporter ATP-binding protein [Bacilli bacterium]